nr:MAG: universal stress protein [Pseudomonadota bacterium]
MQAEKPYVIVVGVDYSPQGELALERAFEIATERKNAEVHIVHVLQTVALMVPVEASVGPVADGSVLQNASEQLRKYADERLQAFRARAAAEGRQGMLFERAVSHVRLDAPAYEIAQLASDLEADLVIVGTHGRRGAARLLVGSVAENVVRLAPCPVLVVRPKSVETQVPKIEPPCPRCVEARRESGGKELWCEQHRERHGRRHTYHYFDRLSADTNFPLLIHDRR